MCHFECSYEVLTAMKVSEIFISNVTNAVQLITVEINKILMFNGPTPATVSEKNNIKNTSALAKNIASQPLIW